MNKRGLLLMSSLLFVSCAQWEQPIKKSPVVIADGRPNVTPLNIEMIADAVPQYEPWSPSVNPKSYTVLGKEYFVLASNKGYKKQGIASWYGTKFHDKKTATGESYDMFAMTAAHKTLPIPSYVRVTNLDNQRSVIVRVNDRGPFHEHRIIDLSYAAAFKLDLERSGTGFVEVEAIPIDKQNTASDLPESKITYLQIGAFAQQSNALLLQQKVAELRLTTSRIVTQKMANKMLYKVQVGPIRSATEADEVIQALKEKGVSNSRFVSE